MNIAYIRPLFPKLSETFLLEEILQLTKLCHRVRVYAARAELDAIQAKIVASNILDEVEYVPIQLGLYLRMRYFLIFAFQFAVSRKFRRQYFAPLMRAAEPAGARYGLRAAGADRPRASVFGMSVQIRNLSLARHQRSVMAREFVPDVIHCPSLFRIGARILRELRTRHPDVPYTVALRARDLYESSGAGVSSTQGPWKEDAVKRAAHLITISRENQSIIAKKYPDRGENIPVVHSGIDVELFRPDERQLREDHLVVAVARLVAKKGLEHLVDACAQLRAQKLPVRCMIVGGGPEREKLQAQIDRLALRECVTLSGSATSEAVRSLLARASVFVLPCVIAPSGDRDVLPNSVKEAMAMKVPVITSRISGIEELIEHGHSGILVPPADSAALALWIARLCGDSALARRLGENGRARICADFDARTEAEKLAAVLAGVVARHASAGRAAPVCV